MHTPLIIIRFKSLGTLHASELTPQLIPVGVLLDMSYLSNVVALGHKEQCSIIIRRLEKLRGQGPKLPTTRCDGDV